MNLASFHYQDNKIFLQLTLTIVAIPLIFWPDTVTFFIAWANNSTYHHGFFIFPISLWLIYRQKRFISSSEAIPEPRVLIVLAAFLLLWFLSYVSGTNVTQQFALVALIPISIWILFGRELLKIVIFPVTFLFFMIPVGAILVPPLMEATADLTVSMIQLSGIPVYRDGLYFTLPTGNWSVIEACSGLNYLVASLTLGMLYSYLTYRSLKKRALFILAIALFSIIANGLRAYGIVIIGHLTKMEHGTGGDHEFYGWLFYGFFVFWFFYLGNIWADQPLSVRAESSERTQTKSLGRSTIGFYIVIFAAMISVQVLAKQATEFDESSLESIQIKLPDNFEAWQYSQSLKLGWKPQLVGSNIIDTRSYNLDGDLVQISLGYYPWQSQGSEAVGWGNRVVGSESEWIVNRKDRLNYNDYSVIETEITAQEKKLLIWNWYLVGNWVTSDPRIAKVLNVLNIVLHQRNDAAFLTLATPVTQNKLDSRKNLEAFYEISHRELHQNLSNLVLEPKIALPSQIEGN